MVQISSALTAQVSSFLEGGDRSFLDTLLEMERNDITGQATVRYLMQLKHWPFTPGSKFAETLEHLFAEYPEREKREPTEYQTLTFDLIKNAWSYECIEIVPETAPERKPNPGKVTRRPRMVKDEESYEEGAGESGSRTYKSLAGNVDTSQASERLKRVIDIQRGE